MLSKRSTGVECEALHQLLRKNNKWMWLELWIVESFTSVLYKINKREVFQQVIYSSDFQFRLRTLAGSRSKHWYQCRALVSVRTYAVQNWYFVICLASTIVVISTVFFLPFFNTSQWDFNHFWLNFSTDNSLRETRFYRRRSFPMRRSISLLSLWFQFSLQIVFQSFALFNVALRKPDETDLCKDETKFFISPTFGFMKLSIIPGRFVMIRVLYLLHQIWDNSHWIPWKQAVAIEEENPNSLQMDSRWGRKYDESHFIDFEMNRGSKIISIAMKSYSVEIPWMYSNTDSRDFAGFLYIVQKYHPLFLW